MSTISLPLGEKFIPTKEVSPSGITTKKPGFQPGFFVRLKNRDHTSFAKATEDKQDPKKHQKAKFKAC